MAVCGLSLVAASGSHSLIAVCGLLIAGAYLVAQHGKQGAWASVQRTIFLLILVEIKGYKPELSLPPMNYLT